MRQVITITDDDKKIFDDKVNIIIKKYPDAITNYQVTHSGYTIYYVAFIEYQIPE